MSARRQKTTVRKIPGTDETPTNYTKQEMGDYILLVVNRVPIRNGGHEVDGCQASAQWEEWTQGEGEELVFLIDT